MKRTAKSVIESYCKRGYSIHEILKTTDLNVSTIKKEHYIYWLNLKQNPVRTEVINGKTVLTIQSIMNFEKLQDNTKVLKAKELRGEGKTLRQIAYLMGYKCPSSIFKLLRQ